MNVKISSLAEQTAKCVFIAAVLASFVFFGWRVMTKRAYVEHEEVMNLVKNQAEIADCKIERYGTTIYLMPDIDNKYLGFTKADLKKELCKPNATDRDYYLAQFVILTLLAEFYDGQGSTSKSREFLKLGELQNIVSERLKAGLALEQEREQDGTNLTPRCTKRFWIIRA